MIDTIRRVGRDKSESKATPADPDSDTPSPAERAPSKELSPEAQQAYGSADRGYLLADVCRDWKDSDRERVHNWQSKRQRDRGKYDISKTQYQRARRLRVRLLKWLNDRGITGPPPLTRLAVK
jgi:hypothetical protein